MTLLGITLVSSKIDYCNSLFSSFLGSLRLQSIQSTLCRVDHLQASSTGAHLNFRHSKSLDWLLVRLRMKVKTSVLIYKTLQNGNPQYLKQHCIPYPCPANTCPSNPDNNLPNTSNFTQKIQKTLMEFLIRCSIICLWGLVHHHHLRVSWENIFV